MLTLEFKDFLKALFSSVYGWVTLALFTTLVTATVCVFSAGSIGWGIALVITTILYVLVMFILLSRVYVIACILTVFLGLVLQAIFPFAVRK